MADRANEDSRKRLLALLRGGDFWGGISSLRSRIEPVRGHLRQGAELCDKMQELCAQSSREWDGYSRVLAEPFIADQTLNAEHDAEILERQRKIENLDRSIEQLWKDSPQHNNARHELWADVLEALDYIPANQVRLQQIASEIRRLRLGPGACPDPVPASTAFLPLYEISRTAPDIIPTEELVSELDRLDHRLGELLSLKGILEPTNDSPVEPSAQKPALRDPETAVIDRQKIYESWKERNSERGALTALLKRIRVHESDFGKWRTGKKFAENSEVSRRIVKALSS